jgi:hypothetical protein
MKSHEIPLVSFVKHLPGQSLFPQEVKNRLLEEKKTVKPNNKMKRVNGLGNPLETKNLQELDEYDDGEILRVKPIADLFPNTTVLFADIVGFTAWSSTRVSPRFLESDN